MATHINYTKAEKRSFRLVPETCPTVEAAIDETFKPPSLDRPVVEGILRYYGFDPADVKLRKAISEVMLSSAFPVKQKLSSIIIHRATMPLRAALVEQVKAAMAAAGEPTDPRNHFQEWVDACESIEAFRAERAAEAEKAVA